MPLFFQSNKKNTGSSIQKPTRIVSLVPSQTELLYDLGLNEEVVGITKFCIHPTTWFRNKERVGGTKNVNIEKIKALKPDLILANKEENVKEQLMELAENTVVWVSEISNLKEALEMIETIGIITVKRNEAKEMVHTIDLSFTQIIKPSQKLKAAYMIWRDPYMVAGGDTFIHNMMQYCGLENVFDKVLRYPVVSIHCKHTVSNDELEINLPNSLSANDCDLILLSSEPYPFAQKHIDELQKYLPKALIMLVDGEMFSWYGSRLQYSAAYFNQLITTWMQDKRFSATV